MWFFITNFLLQITCLLVHVFYNKSRYKRISVYNLNLNFRVLVVKFLLLLIFHLKDQNRTWKQTFFFTSHECMLSHFSHVQLFVTLWTIAHQAPLFMGFSRQEYKSQLPFPSPGDLPDAGIKPAVSDNKIIKASSIQILLLFFFLHFSFWYIECLF